MDNFKESYNFPRFRAGPNIFRGSRGVQLLIPMETYRTCDFPGGSEPLTPLDPRMPCVPKTPIQGIQSNTASHFKIGRAEKSTSLCDVRATSATLSQNEGVTD